MNYFTTISLVSFVGILVLAGDKLSYKGVCPGIFLSYYLALSSIYDIVILQVDRLIAVRAPYFYKSRIHTGLSVRAVIAAKERAQKKVLCALFSGVRTPTTPTTPMDSTPMDSTEYGSTKTYPLQWTPMTDSTC